MNASYEWLRAFVPFDETPAQLRDLLTRRVATVDELVPLRQDLAAIVVARVVEEAPHPDSDRLHVTRVDMGTGELLDVVCGAPNVTAGRLYPFAPTGTVMPNGLKIEKRRIRGATSNGMLCSARELGLGEDQDGILELDIDVAPGTPFLRALPVGDTRIVIDVGANRPDLLSHLGLAREIAAATGRPMQLPALHDALPTIPAAARGTTTAGAAGLVPITIEEPGLVNRFMGAVIRGVTVGPSPEWLVRRLESVGSRSINNVVDASNYVLHELGQPTHAFDLSKLAGPRIVVRRARDGERIVTLDGTDRALDDRMIVIADAERPQAIAGIMGGRDSEVTESTTDIFLEVANFVPPRIRTARRSLGLSTDASYRFERGVDIELASRALERVASLILLLAGGELDGLPADVRETPYERLLVTIDESYVARVLGEVVPADRIARLLDAIGFECEREGSDPWLTAFVPTWRNDVEEPVDVVEEVARLHGYDEFPDEIRPFRAGSVPDDPHWLTSRRLCDLLVGEGLLEARPIPFVAGGDGFVRVANPIAESEAYLRREVLDTLARRAEHNLAHMEGNVRLFEVGAVFRPGTGALPGEELHVGALVMGRRTPPHFTDPKSEEFERWARYGAWDARALAERIARVAYPNARVSLDTPSTPDLGASDVALTRDAIAWEIFVDGAPVGRVGRVVLDAPVWAAEAWGVELSLGVVQSADVAPPGEHAHRRATYPPVPVTKFRPLPTTPAAEFDLALLVPDGRSAGDVEAVIRRTAGELLERLELFDLYVGKGVEAGQRSLAWRLTFRHPERTLRDKEIDGRRAKILGTLEQELNVRQRTS